jgi:hypothetical protein
VRNILARLRTRAVAIAAALTLGIGGLVFAGAALPAQAINCTYGDSFYYFVSQSTAHAITYGYYEGDLVVSDDGSTTLTDGTEFCEVYTGGFGSNFAEWVAKGTDLCITYNTTAGWVDMETCASHAAQEWDLYDHLPPSGSEYWGGFLNYLANGTANYAMKDTGNNSIITVSEPWSQTATFQWDLNGPFS